MPTRGLNPGDIVVDLAALVQTAAILTGGVAGAWLLWMVKRSWLMSGAGCVAGVTVGYVAARVVARVLYRGPGRATTVVKVGASALTRTSEAGLAGGLSTAVLVAVLVLVIFRPREQAGALLFAISIGCGALLGEISGVLAALL